MMICLNVQCLESGGRERSPHICWELEKPSAGRTHKAWALGRGDPGTSGEDRAFGPSPEDCFQLPQAPAAGGGGGGRGSHHPAQLSAGRVRKPKACQSRAGREMGAWPFCRGTW